MPGTFARAIAQETGWAATEIYFGLTIAMLMMAMLSPFVARLLACFGGQRVVVTGTLMISAGCLVMAYVQSLPGWFAAWVLTGAGMRLALYDALFDMLGPETYGKYLERGNIEVAPLAYMRGRTLDDSFIILDEAQNTSREQMKMFLTRLGFGSKIVITGDVTQIDLPDGKPSGLREAMRVLRNVEGIGICELTNADVVRHVMVQRIVKAYEEYETAKNGGKGKK